MDATPDPDAYRAVPQLSDDELAALDEHEDDPEDFRPDLVPDGPGADYFRDGRTGRGLTNDEWDEQSERMKGDPALWALVHGRPLEA